MPRIGIDISEQAHEKLKAHAKRNGFAQGHVVEAMLDYLTEAQVDEAMEEVKQRQRHSREEARALRGMLAKMQPAELKRVIELARKQSSGNE